MTAWKQPLLALVVLVAAAAAWVKFLPGAPEILAGWGEGSVLAITLEPEGGSPSGTPTGPIVAKGAVTRI